MHTYIHTYKQTHACIHIYIHTYIHTYVCTNKQTHACMHTYMHAYIYVLSTFSSNFIMCVPLCDEQLIAVIIEFVAAIGWLIQWYVGYNDDLRDHPSHCIGRRVYVSDLHI